MTSEEEVNARGLRPGRLFGEVSIIVVGVLIALAAEGAREDWIERRLVDSYIENLAADLRADSAEFEIMLGPGYLPAQREASDSLLSILADPGREESGAVILSYLRAQILLPFAKKRRATFEDLLGSGRISLIPDSDLRRDLVEYYSGPVATDQSGYEAYLATSFFPFNHHLMLRLGVGRYAAMASCSPVVGMPDRALTCFEAASQGDELELLRSDEELSALVGAQIFQQFFALDGMRAAHRDALALLQRLDQ